MVEFVLGKNPDKFDFVYHAAGKMQSRYRLRARFLRISLAA
jgi:hypothetical protein